MSTGSIEALKNHYDPNLNLIELHTQCDNKKEYLQWE